MTWPDSNYITFQDVYLTLINGKNRTGVMDVIYKGVRFLIGGVFLYSGITKLFTPVYFSVLIDAYGILPEALTLPTAYVLSILEIIAGIGVLFDIRGSLAIVSGLLLLFMGVLWYGIYMGFDIDCGCFGPQEPESKAFHGLRVALAKDVIMVVGVIYLYVYRNIKLVVTVPLNKIIANRWSGGFKNAVKE